MKKIKKKLKLQIPGGEAKPVAPLGPALGQAQVSIPVFIKQFNDLTKDKKGFLIPVVITVFEDRSFTFITKTPPTSDLIKKTLNITKCSGNSKKEKVGTLTQAQLKSIAQQKMPDLNAYNLESAMKIVAGSAKNMGIEIEEK